MPCLCEALARLLRHLALTRPLVIVLEDVHGADDMTLRFLAFLGRRLHGAPVLVAVSAREEELADSPVLRRTLDELAAELRLVRVTLARLGRDDTTALVRLLGRADGPATAAAGLAERVWEASAGIPSSWSRRCGRSEKACPSTLRATCRFRPGCET